LNAKISLLRPSRVKANQKDRGREPPASEANDSDVGFVCLAPKAQRHLEPWASPKEFELPRQQALKARFNRVSQSKLVLQ
jgi:hypothetical protein